MNQQDYHASFTAQVTPKRAFEGISQVSEWWAKQVEGESQKPNDVFTVRFGETFGTFMITDWVPDRKISWYVTDGYMHLLKDKKEWVGTRIIWDILNLGDFTQINMTHVGLGPGKECFEDCVKGWDFYIKESLFNLLTNQRGIPGAGIRATISNEDRIYKGTLYYKNDPVPEIPNGFLIVDVKKTKVEHVVAIYGVDLFDKDAFSVRQLKGDYYMVVENKAMFGNILPLEDLLDTLH
jgi:hypothetical protein